MGVERRLQEVKDRDGDGFWRARPNLAAPGVSKHGGRGLIALCTIDSGAIIDRACTVEIDESQSAPLDQMRPLGDYYFAHPDNPRAGLMAYGLMVLCNHADPANADIIWWKSPTLGWMADLVARVDIAPGEEITFRYRCPLWFEPAT